jgi:hypothetical protein
MSNRQDLVKLIAPNAIGLELGVARGDFSLSLLTKGYFSKFYGIDMWADHHDIKEYFEVLNKTSKYSNYLCIRSKFEEALSLFEDQYFDFIYIDGYAHTGQNEGRTLEDWYPKLKQGGLFSGHDYSEQFWPKTKLQVDLFCKKYGKDVNVTDELKYPSWYFYK